MPVGATSTIALVSVDQLITCDDCPCDVRYEFYIAHLASTLPYRECIIRRTKVVLHLQQQSHMTLMVFLVAVTIHSS